MATLQCDECGAAARAEAGKFCSYCGAKFSLPEPPPPPREAARAETASRFATLARHPRAQAAMKARVSGAGAVAKHGAGALFALVFVAIAGVVAMMMIGTAGEVEHAFQGGHPAVAPGGFTPFDPHENDGFFTVFKIVPLLIVGVGVIMAVRAMTRTAQVAASPTVARMAHVLEEHTETRGSGEHIRTVHVVTLESDSGRRSSHEVSRALARSLTRGDMGVAHTKGGELVRFRRVDV